MDKNSKYFRDLGWGQLQGRWGAPAVFTLVDIVVSYIVSYFASGILSIFLLPMQYSYEVSFLDNKRTGAEFKLEKLFEGYKDFLRIFGTLFLEFFYTLLWMLLLIVPGIVKAISYSQTKFVLRDNPELSYNAAIERSMEMMQGYKMKYFLLQLSFIGWILLAILTCGLLSLFVNPYISATNAHFYEYVKEEYEKKIAA